MLYRAQLPVQTFDRVPTMATCFLIQGGTKSLRPHITP